MEKRMLYQAEGSSMPSSRRYLWPQGMLGDLVRLKTAGSEKSACLFQKFIFLFRAANFFFLLLDLSAQES